MHLPLAKKLTPTAFQPQVFSFARDFATKKDFRVIVDRNDNPQFVVVGYPLWVDLNDQKEAKIQNQFEADLGSQAQNFYEQETDFDFVELDVDAD